MGTKTLEVNMGTKTLEVTQVTPFINNSPEYPPVSEVSLPLTFCDTFWFKFPPVQRLFLYSLPEPNEILLNSVLPKLKHSLSLTLRNFLPLAGTITWPLDSPKPVVLYRPPNDSLSLTVAESDADFDFLCGYGPRETSAFHSLVPELTISETGASVLSLQVTLFPGKGFSVGVTSHHAFLDGKSTTMFIKSWAHLCKDESIDKAPVLLPPELTPVFDRSAIKDPRGLDIFYLDRWLSFSKHPNPKQDPKLFEIVNFFSAIPPGSVRATFTLSRSDIAKLRKRISSENNNNEELGLSAFVVTYSYVIFCYLKAVEDEIEPSAKAVIGFAVDYRSRLSPPPPENYFGNCVGFMATVVDNWREVSGSPSAVAVKVSGLVKELEEAEDVTEGAEDKMKKLSSGSGGASVGFGVAGSARFGDYKVDFGWGRPRKVEIVSVDRTRAVSMTESGDGCGGVELGVVLKKHQMEVFSCVFVEGLKKSE